MSGRAMILCVGRLNEPFYRDACAEYEKRLQRYMALEVREVPDERDPAKANPLSLERVRAAEWEALARHVRPEDLVLALCIQGEAHTSEKFARALAAHIDTGKRMVFLIGGSNGLSEGAMSRADVKLSLSALTFPHALARLVLLEQIYRGQRILSGEPYHK